MCVCENEIYFGMCRNMDFKSTSNMRFVAIEKSGHNSLSSRNRVFYISQCYSVVAISNLLAMVLVSSNIGVTTDEVWIGEWIDHLYTWFVSTRNYSTTADLHNSQITTAPIKPFSSLVSSPAVLWQQLLTVEVLQLHALRSSLHSLPCGTQMNSLSSKPPSYNVSAQTT
jgi:hypothetical protein